jgi:quinol monooxygenase YgiN
MKVKWSVSPGESRPVASILQGLMISTRAQPGCLGCSLTTDIGARVSINYSEAWCCEEDLKRQLRSERFRMLAELLEQASERPTVEFILPGAVRSIDYAEEIRSVNHH